MGSPRLLPAPAGMVPASLGDSLPASLVPALVRGRDSVSAANGLYGASGRRESY